MKAAELISQSYFNSCKVRLGALLRATREQGKSISIPLRYDQEMRKKHEDSKIELISIPVRYDQEKRIKKLEADFEEISIPVRYDQEQLAQMEVYYDKQHFNSCKVRLGVLTSQIINK